MDVKDIKDLNEDELRELLHKFLEQKQKLLDEEAKNDEEETERETKSASSSKTLAQSVIDHVIQRINLTFQKIAKNLTSSLSNQFKFRKKLPRKQAEQFVKERALAGIPTTKADVDEYIKRVEEKTTKQNESVRFAQREYNPLYFQFVDEKLMDPVMDFLYKPQDLYRNIDNNKIPEGYNGYRTGG